MAEQSGSSKRRATAGDPRLPGGISSGGADRISGLTDDLLGHILSMPVWDAVRLSALSRRWRGAWAHAAVLNISDGQHPDRFLEFAGAALARYGQPDIPSLDVTIGRQSNIGPATVAWLRGAMEHVVGSICVQVDPYTPALDQLVLPRSLRARAMTLDLSGDVFSKGLLVLPEPAEPAAFRRLTELSLTLLHIDLSTLHQFSRQDPHHLVFPDDDAETKAAKPCQDHEYDPHKAQYQLQLGSLRKIRIGGFAGTVAEMELADLLFGVGAERPALERIFISSFAQLKGRIDRIAMKMRARFPLAGGRWETTPLEEITWTKNNDGLERSNALRSTIIT